MASPMTKKVGPLPVWAWGILGGIAVYFLYVRYRSSSANSAVQSPVATALDPNAVDPTTGLTYGQELAGSGPAAGGLQGSADSGVAGGLGGFDTELNDFLTTLTDFGALAGQMGFTPPQPSDTTAAAAESASVDNSTPGPGAAGPGRTSRAAVGASAGPHGAIVAPYGARKPPAKPGYTIVGTGRGGWIYKPSEPQTHKQKTVHVANPGSHQQPVHKPTSTAKPRPVRHPAVGSAGAAVLTRPAAPPAPRPPAPAPRPKPRHKPKPRRR